MKRILIFTVALLWITCAQAAPVLQRPANMSPDPSWQWSLGAVKLGPNGLYTTTRNGHTGTIQLTSDGSGWLFSPALATGGTWGSIAGTLSSQTDLNNALAAKAPLTGAGTSGTWGISVSGNAATATEATHAASADTATTATNATHATSADTATSATTATTATSATTAASLLDVESGSAIARGESYWQVTGDLYATAFYGALAGTTGTFTGSLGVNTGGNAPATSLEVSDTVTSSPRGIMSSQYNNGADGARFHLRKGRGTRATPTTVVTGDTLGKVVASGYDGSNYLEMGAVSIEAEGTVGSTRVPTRIVLSTATNAAPSVLTERMRIDSAGKTTFAGPVALSHVALKVVTITSANSPYTPGDEAMVLCDCSSGAITVNVPLANGESGRVLTIAKIDNAANNVTIARSGTNTLDWGTIGYALTLRGKNRTIVSDGASNWISTAAV